MVPPWVDDPGGSSSSEPPTAPRARFGGARTALGEFATGGSRDKLGRGLRNYTSRGLGGSQTAAQRMGNAVARSGDLYDVLNTLAGSPGSGGAPFGASSLVGASAREIIDTIVDFVSPIDGSQDSESSQRAISDALSDFLEAHPDSELGALTQANIEWVLERHLVYEIHNRVQLDVGKSILNKAPSPASAIQRLGEIRDYIQESVAAAFRERIAVGVPLTRADATTLAHDVLEDTFAVFEEYVE